MIPVAIPMYRDSDTTRSPAIVITSKSINEFRCEGCLAQRARESEGRSWIFDPSANADGTDFMFRVESLICSLSRCIGIL